MSLSDEEVKALLGLAAPGEDEPPRYEPIEPLGEGGMGQVVRVWDGQLLREVARKTLHPDARELAQRFLREARITAQLEHPNIVPVYDLEEQDDGLPSFTMREIRGASLAELIDRRQLGRLGLRLDVFRKVCDAIAYAHDCGVIHRDLKPSNVMVGSFGEVQVVDWGLARVAGEPELDDSLDIVQGSDQHTRHGSVSGTPMFMAPEQAASGSVDERTDVYGLGRLLACLLAGRFVGQSEELQAPWELVAVVRRATAQDPDARYPRVLDLQADVAAWQEDLPLPSLRYTPATRAAKTLRRHRSVALASSLTGLAAGGVLAVAVYLQGAAHVAELQVARDDAVAASEEATQQLARAELALAWSAFEGDDPARAAHHLRQSSRAWRDDNRAELRLARAIRTSRYGRPLRRFEGAMHGRYGPSSDDIALSNDHDTWVWTAEGHSPRISGRLLDWLEAGLLVRVDDAFELWTPHGERRWRLPWTEEYSVAYSPDETLLAVSSAESGTLLLDAATGAVLRRVPQLGSVRSIGPSGELLGCPVGEGSTLHRTSDTTRLLDAEGKLLHTYPGSSLTLLSPTLDRVVWLAEGGELVLAALDGTVQHRLPAGELAKAMFRGDSLFAWGPYEVRRVQGTKVGRAAPLPDPPADVRPDGQALLTTTEDGIEEWALLDGEPIGVEGAITDLALSPDGELVAVSSWSGHLSVLDTDSGRPLLSLPLDPEGLRAVDWSPDGLHLAVAGRGGQALELDLDGTVVWRSPSRGAIATAIRYGADALRVGWEDGQLTVRTPAGTETMQGPLPSLWDIAPGEPLVVSGRGALDAALADASGALTGPESSYGVARRGDQLAVGHQRGVRILRGDDEVDLQGPTTVDVAFLTDDVLLAAGYDEGALSVVVRHDGTWGWSQSLPLVSGRVLTAVAIDGDDLWIGDSEGGIHHLHLGDGDLLTRRDALRHGLADWLGTHPGDGLDAVRAHAVLDRPDRARDALTGLDGPAARLWRNALGR